MTRPVYVASGFPGRRSGRREGGSRTRILVSTLLALLVWSPPSWARGGGDEAPAWDDVLRRRIRTADRHLQAVIDEGMQTSSTFRALVARIHASDVVVYVQCDAHATMRGIAGRLTFISSAGGLRYVMVRMGWFPSRTQQIALLAHELQHAVEIANNPAIVDGSSLAREYQRMGHGTLAGIQMAFDTRAANDVGEQVLRELSGSDRSNRSGRSEVAAAD